MRAIDLGGGAIHTELGRAALPQVEQVQDRPEQAEGEQDCPGDDGDDEVEEVEHVAVQHVAAAQRDVRHAACHAFLSKNTFQGKIHHMTQCPKRHHDVLARARTSSSASARPGRSLTAIPMPCGQPLVLHRADTNTAASPPPRSTPIQS